MGEILDGGMTTEANPRETSAAITILENLIFHFHPGWKHAPPAALPNFYDRFHFPPFPNFRLHSPPEEKRKRRRMIETIDFDFRLVPLRTRLFFNIVDKIRFRIDIYIYISFIILTLFERKLI